MCVVVCGYVLCNVCVLEILVMSWCSRSPCVLSFASSSALVVLIGLLVVFVLFAMFWWILFIRDVVHVWRLYWSCLGVCDRCMFCIVLLCLRWLC